MLRSIIILALSLSSCLIAAGQIQVSDPNPVVHKLSLSNVYSVSPAEQQRIVGVVLNGIGTVFHQKDSEFFDEIAERIRFEFQTLGYFKVFVNKPLVKAIGKDGEREVVDVDVRVDEGAQYRLKKIQLKNGSAFPLTELRAAFPIADADIFDRAKIARGLETLRQLYAGKGFVNFSAVPETMVDEDAHTISLSLDLDEGEIFYLGTLTVLGVESEPGARAKLLTMWNSYQGKIYDYRLLPLFLKDVGARPEVKPEQIFKISPDAKAKVVNVSMTLAKPPVF
ncbi:MAG: hypothetical protein DMG64_04330 [Acidobacteria bacterium]|nr:MAG: hypothetical protein DMG64_04330 [Acidobacteriota bacterium]PYY24546.1 MAG: hypothetical protein DMG62_03000 [Acidobacteriota bacterium]